MTLYFAHSVISRLVRRLLQETKSPKSPANTLVFESLEPRLLLAADPLGITVIEANGSTQLTEVGDHFFLYDGSGSGPSLKYAGTDQWPVSLAPGRRSPRSRRQTGTRLPGRSRAPINTRCGPPTAAAITPRTRAGAPSSRVPSSALKSLEPSFHQDFNGDGLIGPPTTVIEINGSTSLTEVGDQLFPLSTAADRVPR